MYCRDRCDYVYLFETPVPEHIPQLRGQQQAPHPFILIPPPMRKAAPLLSVSADKQQGGESTHRRQSIQVRLVRRSDGKSKTVIASRSPSYFGRGDCLRFELLLMGRAIGCLQEVVRAVEAMSGEGLGAARARFQLHEVTAVDGAGGREVLFPSGSEFVFNSTGAAKALGDLIRMRLDQLQANGTCERVRLNFLTPVRINVKNDLQVHISFELLVRNLLRRVSLLSAVHGRTKLVLDYRGLIELAGGVEVRKGTLTWLDWKRYSNRQQTKMRLGGLIGEVEYGGEQIRELLPLIIAGEILHVGSNTSFGLGRYEVST